MPLFDTKTVEDHAIGGSDYGFSATRLQFLGASEYTLVQIATDVSPSVRPFLRQEEACIAEIVKACARSPRADNLMLRLTAFDGLVREVHGFVPLAGIHAADYAGRLKVGGATAVHDAALNAIEATRTYGRTLKDAGFAVNGLVFVVTDGEDNASQRTPADVRAALAAARGKDGLDSLLAILIGVNVTDKGVSDALQRFHRDAGLDHYLELDRADEATLARLATFATRSIAAQSRALGTGAQARVIGF